MQSFPFSLFYVTFDNLTFCWFKVKLKTTYDDHLLNNISINKNFRKESTKFFSQI